MGRIRRLYQIIQTFLQKSNGSEKGSVGDRESRRREMWISRVREGEKMKANEKKKKCMQHSRLPFCGVYLLVMNIIEHLSYQVCFTILSCGCKYNYQGK